MNFDSTMQMKHYKELSADMLTKAVKTTTDAGQLAKMFNMHPSTLKKKINASLTLTVIYRNALGEENGRT